MMYEEQQRRFDNETPEDYEHWPLTCEEKGIQAGIEADLND